MKLRITGPRRRAKRPVKRHGYEMATVYVYPTTQGDMTPREMAAVTGGKENTIKTRLARNGWDDPDILSTDPMKRCSNYGAMPSGKAKRKIKPAFAAGTLEEKYL